MAKLVTAVAALLCALGLILPGAGEAATSPVVDDCTSHGRLTHPYSVTQLHTALAQMPADVQEYTNCYAVIQHALLAQVSSHPRRSGNATKSSSSSLLPTPVIVVIVLLALAGAGYAFLALRRRE